MTPRKRLLIFFTLAASAWPLLALNPPSGKTPSSVEAARAGQHAAELEEAIWQHLPDLRPVSDDHFGALPGPPPGAAQPAAGAGPTLDHLPSLAEVQRPLATASCAPRFRPQPAGVYATFPRRVGMVMRMYPCGNYRIKRKATLSSVPNPAEMIRVNCTQGIKDLISHRWTFPS